MFFKYTQLFVYGVITPGIVCFGIYLTFTQGFKRALKEAISETIDLSIKKHIRESFDSIKFFSKKN